MNSDTVILFDLSGVLVELGGMPDFIEWTGKTSDDIGALWLKSESVRSFERGHMSFDDFHKIFVKEWDVAIPGEVSVVSYGNTELTSYYSPGITSVDCNYPMMAREIAEHISCGSMPCKRQLVISPELIIRET